MGLRRGAVFFVNFGNLGPKPVVVVSNHQRNSAFGDALAARITTTKKVPRRSVVELSDQDPVAGSVLCDDITTIYPDELSAPAGYLSPATMSRVAEGLKATFAIP